MRLLIAAFGHVLDIGFGREPELEEIEEGEEEVGPPAHTSHPMEVYSNSAGFRLLNQDGAIDPEIR